MPTPSNYEPGEDRQRPMVPSTNDPPGPTTGSTLGSRLANAVCHTTRVPRMTMLSFRVDDRDAHEAQRWAEALGIDRSQLLRDALRRHLDRLASETDSDRWHALPLDEGELAMSAIADWGAAEDWSDWE